LHSKGFAALKGEAMGNRIGDPALASRLKRALRGEVLFDPFSRGRYSTDASIYRIEPIGVTLPRDTEDVEAAIAIAREEGVPVLPRGAGSSQSGQTVNEAVVMDTSRHMTRLLDVDVERGTATVQPGIVLDRLNKELRATGWHFPIDVSTSSVATIGGMTGNNSAGGRSIKYGIMVHNVLEIETVLADGSRLLLGGVAESSGSRRVAELAAAMRALYRNHAAEIALRYPKVMRNVAGYNIHTMGDSPLNLASLLVGSEGTLGFFTKIKLRLHRLPAHRVQGVCHFERLHDSMAAVQHIVTLGPTAVELVDSNMLDLARGIPAFRNTIESLIKGSPEALLLVEFAGEDQAELLASLGRLEALVSDLGYPDSVVRATETGVQAKLAELRKAGLNIMMSMRGDGKPVSFIEDCAVPLKDLAEYTDRLIQVFERNGTKGTLYAHASVGCLHVRPVLNMKNPADVKKRRRIAEEAFAIVREYKGSHSGEHGDGLVRSEFHEVMYGAPLVRAFEAVKDAFDPTGLFNPGRIVRPPRMDDRGLFRYKPEYARMPVDTALDWSDWGGFLGAVEMCNNNGACRKADAGVMCPSSLTAYLPRYAHWASRLASVLNLRNRSPLLAAVAERVTGLSARRTLPRWRRDSYRASPRKQGQSGDVVLLVDCFSRYFEPENARAARTVLEAGGYTVLEPDTTRPLCCGRTFLSAGLVAQAREEMSRLVDAVGADAQRGVPIVGIEPSCHLTLRDELTAVLKGDAVDAVAGRAVLFEEFLAREARAGKLHLALRNDGPREAYLHGHCHQKAFGTMPDVVAALKLVPGLAVKQIESSCCGMAGSFGYEPGHEEISLRMAERDLLPAVRKAPQEALIVADGTSCRYQIADHTSRTAVHVSRVLEAALAQ
jgi:FAD/FMN-containing dehydrogenase/Fe-S oxidoreductase